MEGIVMTKSVKQNYISSIEYAISIICENMGSDVVTFVFQKYGTQDVYDLSPGDLPEVFRELEYIASDCC